MKMISCVWLLLAIQLIENGYSQTAPQLQSLSMGDTLPALVITKVNNVSDGRLNTSDLKGRIVLIDFWSRGCISCIGSFPKMEAFQKQYGKDLQIIVVTHEAKDKVEAYMKEQRFKLPSNLPSIIGDTVFSSLFPHLSFPHHVWIGRDGVVKAITFGHNATTENIEKMIAGKPVMMNIKKDKQYDFLKTPIWYYAGSRQVQYSSVFLPFFGSETGGVYQKIDDTIAGTYRNLYRDVTMHSLFVYAYRERLAENCWDPSRVIWEVKNPQQYLRPKDPNLVDAFKRRYWYSYEQVIPKRLWHKRYQYMQEDVNRFFGDLYGITARVEKKQVKCLVLRRLAGLDTTQSKKREVIDNKRLVRFINFPFGEALSEMKTYYQINLFQQLTIPFLDKTGYSGSVNLEFSKSIRNLQDLKEELLKNGLSLTEEETFLDMLVITEHTADHLNRIVTD